ncbi:hypothetical protein [Streptomyces sp. OE57]|uniref:hypothetical protein n=1 Tax=Streptomyces lacaronensis TaxID=3379885 RepID=UPI0039B74444
MAVRDFLRSLRPGDDRALAAQLRQSAEERTKRQAEAREAERKKNARAHKRRLAREGSGARLF